MTMLSCKIHDVGEKMAALADSYLIGKTIKNGEIEVFVSPDFYGSEKFNEKKVLTLITGSTIINAIGRKSVKLLAGKGLVDEKSVLDIGGIPHAQIICIKK